jgi:hypothetical protein
LLLYFRAARLYLVGKPVYPLDVHYNQAWRPLPDYGVYQLILIADLALPGNWQLGK